MYFYNLTIFYVIFYILSYCVRIVEQRVNGRYTSNIIDYDLMIPHRMSASGEFITFTLPQYYVHDFRERYKRDSPLRADILHYNVVIEDRNRHVELWPNHGFVSPNLVKETYRPDLRVAERKLERIGRDLCHYIGRVRGERYSSVALSLCDGLTGYVVTDTGQYFIEPVAGHEPNANGEHVHIVYKRESDLVNRFSPGANRCGNKNDWAESWLRQLRNRRNDTDQESETDETSGMHSKHRYLEVLAVADKKFINFHKNIDVKKYIMTLMNMVSNYYHDSSVGNQLDVVLVRLMMLEKEDEHMDLIVNQNADDTLANFCKWQLSINPADIANPQHHDIALLMTRYDLCADNITDCSLLGLAYVAAACDPKQACAINEDTGLTLGITMTHEMGHVMGCGHDNGEDSPCKPQMDDGNYHIMAPSAHMSTTKWSSCSRKFITQLFENGLGNCLNDEPQESLFEEDDMPPGSVYDVDFQCNLDFPGATKCQLEEANFCEKLFCRDGASCRSKGQPPADGTSCGENKWCFKGQCVEIGKRPESVDGNWGEWKEWSQCSRSCGAGVTISERECNNPMPKNKGRYCLGERKRVKLCNTDPCDSNSKSFRAMQCSEFDSKPFQDKLHKWDEYFEKKEPCKLLCINEQRTYVELAPRVKDGTPCKPGSRNKCIFGVCRKIGCDNEIDSNAEEDQCGVCQGDGTKCSIVRKIYEDRGNGYQKIAEIPKDSRNIRVTEKKASQNTIAVGDGSGEKYYLNGNFIEERDGDYDFGGARGIYDHPSPDTETLVIAGPLTKPITLYEVFYAPENPGIEYQYADPSGTSPSVAKPVYNWEFVRYGDCSALCGKGIQISQPECVEKTEGKVADSFCAQIPKPEEKAMDCNEHECKIKWSIGGWGKCSGCVSKSGVKTRKVECIREANEASLDPTVLEDSECREAKPATERVCCSNDPCTQKRRMTNEYEDKIAALLYQIKRIKRNVNRGSEYQLKRHEHSIASERRETSRGIPSKKQQQQQRKRSQKFHTRYTRNECLESPGQEKQHDIVTDTVPAEDVKLIEVPVKGSKEDVKLSDEAFEKEGETVVDTLDYCRERVYTGKEAEEKLREYSEETLVEATTTIVHEVETLPEQYANE